MRTFTAFVVTLLVLIGGGVAADAVLTDRAERAAADRIGAQLGADAEVRFGGWPVSLRLLVGHVAEAGVVLRDVPAGDVTLRRVEAELRDVRIDAGAALAFGAGAGPAGAVLRAGQGRLDAEIGESAVSELVGAPVRIVEGQATVETPAGPVDAVVGLEDGQVVLRPVGEVPDGATALRFEPPELPGDARVTGAQLGAGVARLQAEIRRLGD